MRWGCLGGDPLPGTPFPAPVAAIWGAAQWERGNKRFRASLPSPKSHFPTSKGEKDGIVGKCRCSSHPAGCVSITPSWWDLLPPLPRVTRSCHLNPHHRDSLVATSSRTAGPVPHVVPWLCHPPQALRALQLRGLLEEQSSGVRATLALPQPHRAALRPFPSQPAVCCCHLTFILIAVALMRPRGLCAGCRAAGSLAGAITSWAGAFPFVHLLATPFHLFISKSRHPRGAGDPVRVSEMGFSWDYVE